jgi:tRNA 2-thiouridine synthesizing protein A
MRLYPPLGDPPGDPPSGGKPSPPDPLGTQDPSAAAGSGPFFETERTVVPPSGLVPALTIDALGRKCPIPIIMLAEQIRDVPLGAVIEVLADDPAAYTDVPSWCAMKAQEFAGYTELASGWALYIRRMLLGPDRAVASRA